MPAEVSRYFIIPLLDDFMGAERLLQGIVFARGADVVGDQVMAAIIQPPNRRRKFAQTSDRTAR
jgi:hypothetical protein